MNLTRLWAITRKEFQQIIRDKGTLRIILALPMMMMAMFGYAVSTDVEQVPTAVLLQDSSPQARELIARFEQSEFFLVTHWPGAQAQLDRLIQFGDVKIGLVIPPDYSARLARGEQAQVQVLIDGSDPLVSRGALSTAQIIANLTGTEILAQRLRRAGLALAGDSPIDLRPRVWYNPNMESIKFNMPGLVGTILQNLTMILTSMALVRERERGTIEQLIVTPVRSLELIVGKLIPYVVIAYLDVAIVLVVSILFFKMEIVGSLWLLLGSAFVFLLGTLGQGLLISSMAQTQLQAMQLSQFFIMPAFILSGFMFPREAMPPALQVLGYGIPLTYFLQVLRGIILKGSGWTELWPQILGLTVFGAIILVLAAVRLRKKLD